MKTLKSKKFNYQQKFSDFSENNYFKKLDPVQRDFLKDLAFKYKLTFQEFRKITETALDLVLWQETDLKSWYLDQIHNHKELSKKVLFGELNKFLRKLRKNPTIYPNSGLAKPEKRENKKIKIKKSEKEIYGMCPVASPKTVCCNLRTIDAVENCVFGCSYCSIQTFYTPETIFDADFVKKLNDIKLSPNRFYHFGSGQSSDSLAWGNREGNLDALCKFAQDNPNILLEFKTKSNNISYFQENSVPNNIVCSFSLNTDTIVNNEEHFTASLNQRIEAAKALTQVGIKVAFHFHPMVYYVNWENEYKEIAQGLIERFSTNNVLFVSFGSVTLIKPVIKKIRILGNPTKSHQIDLVPDPHGKLTYRDEFKIKLFSKMYNNFKPWHQKVFFYLCMEKEEIWKKSLGYVYSSNDEFEQDFGKKTMSKIGT